MQEKYSFILTLNSKQFRIPFLFKNIVQMNPDIGNALINDHQYQVKSSISESIFTSFIEFLVHDQYPIISPNDIQSYSQLNDEFQFQPLSDLIIKNKFENQFDTNFPNLKIIEEASKKDTEYKHLVEETISTQLDDYLFFYSNSILNLPFSTLKNIFNHPKRKLTNHNFAYSSICNNYFYSKNINLLSLLPTLDGSKLSDI